MDGRGYEWQGASPLRGAAREQVRAFLARMGLRDELEQGYTVTVCDAGGELAATGTLSGNILRCIAVSPALQGEDLGTAVVSHLVSRAAAQGITDLFVFTKPGNRGLFLGMGFSEVARTDDVLLLESRPHGLVRYLEQIREAPAEGPVGAVVANCNPFTRGHLYLAEQAARACAQVYFFVLMEEQPPFTAAERLELARQSLAHLPNVKVCSTGGYLISRATFPTYFIKEQGAADGISCALDLELFCGHFAPALGITVRYVGAEPFCPVTRAYNACLQETLPAHGIEVREITRTENSARAISASEVRRLYEQGDMEALRPLVTAPTWAFLSARAPSR